MVSVFGPARSYNKTEILTKKASILTYEEWDRKASFEQYFFFTWDNEIQNDIIAVLLPRLSYLTIK